MASPMDQPGGAADGSHPRGLGGAAAVARAAGGRSGEQPGMPSEMPSGRSA